MFSQNVLKYADLLEVIREQGLRFRSWDWRDVRAAGEGSDAAGGVGTGGVGGS